MNQTTIYYKTKTKLIEEIEKYDYIKTIKEPSFIKKLTFSKQEYPDIFFHSGIVDGKAIDLIKNSKKVIVNSKANEEEILLKTKIPKENISVIYPSINIEDKKIKDIKTEICEKLNIDKKNKIILFTAKNLKKSGIKEFIEIIYTLTSNDFQVIIAGDSTAINNLRFQISKYNTGNKLILIEDYPNMDDLYYISDIFILPTYNTSFALSVLKAMYCKCAVFVSFDNHAKELLDVFSMMESPSDSSTPFKVDALLNSKSDLKLIKKQNRKIAKEFTLSKNLEKLNDIIHSI